MKKEIDELRNRLIKLEKLMDIEFQINEEIINELKTLNENVENINNKVDKQLN